MVENQVACQDPRRIREPHNSDWNWNWDWKRKREQESWDRKPKQLGIPELWTDGRSDRGRFGGGGGGCGDVSAIQSDSGDGEKGGTITKITLPVSEIYANSVYSQR